MTRPQRYTQFDRLLQHMEAGNRGTAKELATQLDMESGYCSKLLKGLVGGDYVKAVKAPRDVSRYSGRELVYTATSVLQAEQGGNSLVGKALVDMPDLQRFWMRPQAQQHQQGEST